MHIKKTMTCDAGIPGPGLRQAHTFGRVKPANGIPTLPLLIIGSPMQYIHKQTIRKTAYIHFHCKAYFGIVEL